IKYIFSSSFHLRRPALAFVGCCGPSWAFVGVVRANYGCGGYEINCPFKKKLTYGPNDASSVVWALFHLRFIFVGLRWPSLANVGLCGRRPGQLWVKKLTYGPNDASSVVWAFFHLCFIFVGLRWPSLADVGLCGRRPGQLGVWWVRNKLYIQKKTHLWPKRRIYRRLVPFSSLFHLRRPSLAFVG